LVEELERLKGVLAGRLFFFPLLAGKDESHKMQITCFLTEPIGDWRTTGLRGRLRKCVPEAEDYWT
jgi:hypothetical protein